MRSIVTLSALVMVAIALPMRKREGPLDDLQHWSKIWGTTEEELSNVSKEEIERYTGLMLRDLNDVIKTLDSLLSGKGLEDGGEKALYQLGGMIMLTEIDAADESSIKPMELPEDKDSQCSADAVEKQNGCDAKFGVILRCIRRGVAILISSLKSDDDALKKIKFSKAVINKIGSKAAGIFELAEECYDNQDNQNNENQNQHWIDTWTASEDDVKNAPADQIERYVELLLRDLGRMVQSFDVVLSGKGGEEEGTIALHHIAGAIQLLQLDAVSGETSIKPMQLPENSDQGCTADIEKQDTCDAKFGLILRCIRGGVVAVIDSLRSNQTDIIEKISFTKAVINRIGAGAKGVFQLADMCYGKNSDRNTYQHWVDTWKASEEDVAHASPEETQRYTDLLLRDLNEVKNNLNALLSGEDTKENGFKVMQHVGGMMELLQMDADDEKAIRPLDLPADANDGCTPADVEKMTGCDKKFELIFRCMKQGVDATIQVLQSDADKIKKIGFVKAVINGIGASGTDIFRLAGHCYEDGNNNKRENKNYDHWMETWMATSEDVQTLPQEEVDRYTSLLLRDLREVVQNLDHLMGGGDADKYGKKAMEHLGGMLWLLKTHSEAGEKAIQPMQLPPGSDQGCTSADVENTEGCDAKFGLIFGCVRKGVEAVIQNLESDTDAVTKIGFAKAVIHSIGAEAEGIFKLADQCYGEKTEKSDEKVSPSQAPDNQRNREVQRLARILRQYLNEE
ncbi:uncharacterized protein LOC128190882 isoform X2 [Crassostrea angulata]|uniref:uncharacterized protein LOC128190882 isoform X2 n=1 Tax=Magallana angulata TaxID=2784310 RepID=UPI0022B11237|nr:uncharacterized protein LOC128190882 isoform X2 [Crassostrea angulata]